MITKCDERKLMAESASQQGNQALTLDKLIADDVAPAKLRTYAKASLEPGGEVSYHVHEGESESYYIMSGHGEYNDDGKCSEVGAGDATFTPSGHGHGIRNIGDSMLEFMALIIRD